MVWLRRLCTLSIVVGVLIVLSGVITGSFVAYSLHQYTPSLSTEITDRNGQPLQYVFADKHRLNRPLSEISPHLQHATIALEDQRFYDHPGVDILAIARAVRSIVIDKRLQGGSTITQQYVKNAFLTSERTLTRKLKEGYLALVMETMYDKNTILEKYLNEVPYGGVYYGAETAARHYFNRSAADVTVAQAAFLAALTKAPSQLLERESADRLHARQLMVINKMAELGYITAKEKETALNEPLNLTLTALPFAAPHFSTLVKEQLVEKYGLSKVETGGLKVVTTLDLNAQNFVQGVVTSEVNQLSIYHVTNGAAVVLQPSSGEVLAWVGSKDFSDESIGGQYDVLTAYRQPGSALKPFLYTLALQSGYPASTLINDVKTTYITDGQTYEPVNYDGQFHGPVSIREALANSYNVPATRMAVALGVDRYINFLKSVSFPYIDEKRAGISIALGGYEVRPVDLATAYTIFANQGSVVMPTYILSVVDPQGQNVWVRHDSIKRVASPAVTYIISDILSDAAARTPAFGTNNRLSLPGVRVGVKTGTSNDKRDNWTIGFTPEVLVLTWVGNNDNSSMTHIASGLTGASPIWRNIFDQLAAHQTLSWYDKPSDIVQAEFDRRSGGKFCDSGEPKSELFVSGTEPQTCKTPEMAWEPGEGKAVLYEDRGGAPVAIKEMDPEEEASFNQDPLAFIRNHGDILEADDHPTNIYIKREQPVIVDPLVKAMALTNRVAGITVNH